MLQKYEDNIVPISILLFGLLWWLTGRFFISLLLSGIIVGLIWVIISGVDDIKGYICRGKGFAKVVAGSLVAVIVFGFTMYAVLANQLNLSDRCINCGKNAMWTESGFCYSCYKEAESYYD